MRGRNPWHTRANLSRRVYARGGKLFFKVSLPSPSFFFLFSFFLLSSPLPFPRSFCSRPPNHGDSIPRFVRSKGGEGGNGMNRCCCRFLGAGLFFFLSLSLLLFSFFRSLFLYGARITQGKLNFCNVRTGKGGREGFVIDRSNDRSIRFFASCFLYIYIRVLIF